MPCGVTGAHGPPAASHVAPMGVIQETDNAMPHLLSMAVRTAPAATT